MLKRWHTNIHTHTCIQKPSARLTYSVRHTVRKIEYKNDDLGQNWISTLKKCYFISEFIDTLHRKNLLTANSKAILYNRVVFIQWAEALSTELLKVIHWFYIFQGKFEMLIKIGSHGSSVTYSSIIMTDTQRCHQSIIFVCEMKLIR